MDSQDRSLDRLKMCLNHSQSGIEESLMELESDFRSWLHHPHQRTLWSKLIEHLISFRWVLDQHFTRVAGEGYLENIASRTPGLYPELREIEFCQLRLIDVLDALVHDVQNYDPERDWIGDIFEQFRSLHRDILVEESQERWLVERGLA